MSAEIVLVLAVDLVQYAVLTAAVVCLINGLFRIWWGALVALGVVLLATVAQPWNLVALLGFHAPTVLVLSALTWTRWRDPQTGRLHPSVRGKMLKAAAWLGGTFLLLRILFYIIFLMVFFTTGLA